MMSEFKISLVVLLIVIRSTAYSIVFTTTQAGGNSSKDITVQAGKQYQLKFDLQHQTTSAVRIQIIENSVTIVDASNLIDGTHVFSFTPTTNTVTLKFIREDNDNVSRDFEVNNLFYEEVIQVAPTVSTHEIGRKEYELTDHLGNVRAVISDKKVNGYVEVFSATDYLPFGMVARSYANGSIVRYGFGFNGKEQDEEGLGGGGSTYDYGFRVYNPSLAKFLSVDPLSKGYPWYAPYLFAGNMPIAAIDMDGLEEYLVIYWQSNGITTHTTIVKLLPEWKVDANSKDIVYAVMDDKAYESYITQKDGKKVFNAQKFGTEHLDNESNRSNLLDKGKNSWEQIFREGDQIYVDKLEEEKANKLKNVNGYMLDITESDKTRAIIENALPSPQGITFETGKSNLTDESKKQLDNVVELMEKYPDAKFTIEGHTDNVPKYDAKGNIVPNSNEKLSQARADAVKSYLESKGIDGSRLIATGKADSSPIATNGTVEGRAQNRRIEFKLQK